MIGTPGGTQIKDWAFGITDAERAAKASYRRGKPSLHGALSHLLDERPRVSVVVCSYNGGATLDECLRSLCALNYPDFEVIVVDDGSTTTREKYSLGFPQSESSINSTSA